MMSMNVLDDEWKLNRKRISWNLLMGNRLEVCGGGAVKLHRRSRIFSWPEGRDSPKAWHFSAKKNVSLYLLSFTFCRQMNLLLQSESHRWRWGCKRDNEFFWKCGSENDMIKNNNILKINLSPPWGSPLRRLTTLPSPRMDHN